MNDLDPIPISEPINMSKRIGYSEKSRKEGEKGKHAEGQRLYLTKIVQNEGILPSIDLESSRVRK